MSCKQSIQYKSFYISRMQEENQNIDHQKHAIQLLQDNNIRKVKDANKIKYEEIHDLLNQQTQVPIKIGDTYKISVFQNKYKEYGKIYRCYRGLVRRSSDNNPISIISVYQFKQFPNGTPNTITLPNSFEIFNRIIRQSQKYPNTIENIYNHPINKRILKLYDWVYIEDQYNLYVFAEQFHHPLLEQVIQILTESELIIIISQIIEALNFLSKKFPKSIRYFNPLKDVYVNIQQLEIKIFGFGIQRDCITKYLGRIEQWPIYQHPLTAAGRYFPSQEYWDGIQKAENEQNISKQSPIFPKYKDEMDKDTLQMYTPFFEEKDLCWSVGLIIFQHFNKRLPTNLTPVCQNYLKIQKQFSLIAVEGLQKCHQINDNELQKWKNNMGLIWWIIVNAMFKGDNQGDKIISKENAMYSEYTQQLLQQIFIFKEQQKSLLDYWYAILIKMQQSYIPQKYESLKTGEQHIQFPNKLNFIKKSDTPNELCPYELQSILFAVHQEIKYLILQPRIYNYILTSLSYERKQQPVMQLQTIYQKEEDQKLKNNNEERINMKTELQYSFFKGYKVMFNRLVIINKWLEAISKEVHKTKKEEQSREKQLFSKNLRKIGEFKILSKKWIQKALETTKMIFSEFNEEALRLELKQINIANQKKQTNIALKKLRQYINQSKGFCIQADQIFQLTFQTRRDNEIKDELADEDIKNPLNWIMRNIYNIQNQENNNVQQSLLEIIKLREMNINYEWVQLLWEYWYSLNNNQWGNTQRNNLEKKINNYINYIDVIEAKQFNIKKQSYQVHDTI